MKFDFKNKFPFEKRFKEASILLEKYPDRVPIIVEKIENKSFWKNEDELKKLNSFKFLAPRDLTVGQLLFMVRKKLELSSENALFLFINNKMPLLTSTLGSIYSEENDKDQFLYIQYSQEATFG